MKEKKHIDRLFQEKLKNFEAKPNAAVWNKIEAQLRKDKKDRKVIPIWWRVAGVAAGLVLLITVGYSILNNSDDVLPNLPTEVVKTKDENNATKEEQNLQNVNAKEITDDLLKNNLAIEDKTSASQKDSLEQIEQPKANSPQNSSSTVSANQNNAIVNSSTKNREQNQSLNNLPNNQNGANTSLVQSQVDIREDSKHTDDNTALEQREMSETMVNNIPQNLPEQPAIENATKNNLNDNTVTPAEKETVAEITTPLIEKEDPIKETTDELKPLVEDALVESEDAEEIDEKEEEVIDRWSVTPNVAPVYFNSLGKGSSIHSQFNENSKSGEINIAYGVKASYAVSNKVSIRSGINKVNVGYGTNNVVVFQSINTGINTINAVNNNAISNIDMNSSTRDTSIISGEAVALEVPNVVLDDAKTTLNQEISFIEVPVEIAYKLSDRKLDVNVIGGVSTMILDSNSLYTDVNNERVLVGEANNINSVSYSANVGLGLDYEVSRRVSINVEPTFKYQINTFNNTSGEFRPYIVGINSGLKFKF